MILWCTSDTHLRTHEPQTPNKEIELGYLSDTHLRTHEPQTVYP